MDEKRLEEWAEVFAEDVVVAFPDDLPGAPPVRGRAAVVATVSRALAEARTVHATMPRSTSKRGSIGGSRRWSFAACGAIRSDSP
jgi:hypothetical protein